MTNQIVSNSLQPMLIAEISANHLGSLTRAIELIDASKNAGANFVKFQHLKPETITVAGPHPDLWIGDESPWSNRSLWELYSEAAMPWEWTARLVDHCHKVGIGWLSTPFDETAVDFLEQFSPALYKVASFEIVDIPLIRHIAATGKPVILSTGMSSEEEIDRAVSAATAAGSSEVILLRTNSGYPSPLREMDLATISVMREKWKLRVGLSDHTLGSTSAVVAAALGATVFEKHITLSRKDGGPDASFSSEPDELRSYFQEIHRSFEALGSVRFGPSPSEIPNLQFRPSLRAVEDIDAGGRISFHNVRSVRPGGGLAPEEFGRVLGRMATRRFSVGDPITWQGIE